MAYARQRSDWKNYPDATTPIRAEDLNGIEAGLVAAAGVADTALSLASTAAGRAANAEASASSAASSASNAAASAANSAALVNAPADTAIATVLNTPASASGTALSAAIAAERARVNALGTSAPSRTDKYRPKLATVRAATGYAKVLCIGDSTTHGVGATSVATGSYPAQLRALLHAEYAPAWGGLAIAPYYVTGNDDTRFTLGSGWGLGGGSVAWANGSTFLAQSGAAGALTYKPGATSDTFDIYWVRNTGLGTLSVSINGGAATTIPTAGAVGIQKTTVTAASNPDPTVSITNDATGQAFVVGIDAYSSTLKSVRIGNAGVSSSTADLWRTSGPNTFKSLDAVKAYAPDLSIISLGVNDSTPTALSAANFNAYLSQTIDACKVSGDVILMSQVPSAPASGRDLAAQLSYRDEMKKLAVYKGCVFIDLTARWVDFATANAKGWMADNLHPTTAGYADIARAVADTLALI